MRQHVGSRRHHRVERVVVPAKIGNQHLDSGSRVDLSYCADRRREVLSATIAKIVAVHGRNDGVLAAELPDGFGHVPRLVRVEIERRPLTHRAEAAKPRADVPHRHEGGGPIRPTLPDVGTPSLLTDRVEAEIVHHPEDFRKVLVAGDPNLEPLRSRLVRSLTRSPGDRDQRRF